MTKTTTISQETIGDSNNYKGIEKIETITPETINLPNYDYGQSQNTLDANVALRNFSSNNKAGFKVVSPATVPYDVVVTGVGFKPKSIIINANPAISGHSVFSNGSVSDGETGSCIYAHDNNNTIFTGTSYSTTKVIYLTWQGPASVYPDIEAELKSMDSDGFTLTVTRNDQANSLYFNYTCI